MTAWIAGLSFLSANLGSLELMGWAAAAYQYGILATHWYWIGAIPAMLFLGLVMMPFYYISQNPLRSRLLKLRYGEGAALVSGIFRGHDGTDERYQHVRDGRGDEGYPWLGHSLQYLGLDHYRRGLCRLGRVASAIFNEVLQFVLIWAGALLIPILGLIDAGGWSGMRQRIAA